MTLKFEPFVLHVEVRTASSYPLPPCVTLSAHQPLPEVRNLEAASILLAAATQAGLRESGIATVNKRIMVAVRGSIRLEVPLVHDGRLLVGDQYILHLAELGNKKMTDNFARIDRFTEAFRAGISSDPVEALPSTWAVVAPRASAEKLRVDLDRAGLYDGSRHINKHGEAGIVIPISGVGAMLIQALLS